MRQNYLHYFMVTWLPIPSITCGFLVVGALKSKVLALNTYEVEDIVINVDLTNSSLLWLQCSVPSTAYKSAIDCGEQR
ncbi:hypothetical protein NPIL_575721 [Nephila pilipes]|uniref:Uncharacterized protein n=1 Tax=Nephila pilipes TaxID=299642 RepID=A0A8X6U405_NEPPI|nr:hypothetical protein NPIL_575721 [Nephila pilipes]